MSVKHPKDEPPLCSEHGCMNLGDNKVIVEGGGLLGYLCDFHTEWQEYSWMQNRVDNEAAEHADADA